MLSTYPSPRFVSSPFDAAARTALFAALQLGVSGAKVLANSERRSQAAAGRCFIYRISTG
jgi:hypothetical protein